MVIDKDIITEKRAQLDKLLEQQYVYLHINTKVPGVDVPLALLAKPTITLQFSRYFRGAMELKDNLIEADLLFDSDYYHCIVPLASVWGATDSFKKTQVWPDALTPEILGQIAAKEKQSKQAGPKAKKAGRSHLKRVK
ncbi:MAG: hypothetical protein DCC75_08975 [Proteobacteria bacterium]|nr:MAG: hypothetical protein DCC75_08975 [Pseudomonadota bacterium]